MSDNIALTIQTEIMKRLPVISLIRFRAVSKQWKSVIDSPKFIADHCVIQQSQNHHLLLISCLESSWGFSIVDDDDDDDDTFPHQQQSVNLLHSPRSLVAVSGGGLFCIYGSNTRNIMNAVICNPSIKKTVTIVVPNVSDETIVGFGVCPRASDPKLVKITFHGMYQEEYATIPNQVEVFSLSSGLWKPPLRLPRKSIRYMLLPQVAINQFIYWLVYDMSSQDWNDQCCRLIMSFHLTSEEFTQVYLPHSLANCKTHVYMSKLNESLVVLEQNHASNAANVWIMQYDGAFTRMFTFNTPITSLRDVAGFRKNGELILVQLKKDLKEKELIVYQPNSKQIYSTGIAGAFNYFSVSPYTQTLLLLDHKDSVAVNAIGKQVVMAASSSTTSDLDFNEVDDSYFAALIDDDEIFPISDEKYAEELQLQEALISSSSLLNIPSPNDIASSSNTKPQPLVDSFDDESNQSPKNFCDICMDTKTESEIFRSVNVCSHLFCFDCIRGHVASKIKENLTIVTCPDPKCDGVIGPEVCKTIVPKEVLERWENALCESLIMGSEKFYCPFKDCSAMLVDDGGEDVTASECPHCNRLFCAQCNVTWHSGMDCSEFQSLNKDERDPTDIMLMDLAKNKKWRRCPSCKYYVERTEGCLHITCMCGYHFCYGCGEKHTSSHACA